jgi:hypothetical protein
MVENMELAHRRAAVHIVSQLPEAQADALLILEAARDFVLKFLAEDEEAQPLGLGGRECVVLSLVPPASASVTSAAAADLTA